MFQRFVLFLISLFMQMTMVSPIKVSKTKKFIGFGGGVGVGVSAGIGVGFGGYPGVYGGYPGN